jgi:predicted nucleotidyltransferase
MSGRPAALHELTETVLADIVRRLVAELAPRAIYLFGSCAYGKPTPDSDIDLLIVVDHEPAATWELGKRGYACLYGLGLPVELHFTSRTNFERFSAVVGSIHREVRQRGRILYAA